MTKSKRILLIAAAVVLGLIAVAGIGGVIYYNAMLNKLNIVEVEDITYTEAPETLPPETQETTEATQPHIRSSADYLNILVVGQAARKGEESRMADTMLLCTINTYDKTLTMTSMLRDSFVKMPDFKGHSGGQIKLTTVYHLGSYFTQGDENEKIAGSMEIINQCLYDNFGIEVDHNIEVSFELFIKIVDMLGGVAVELTEAEANYLNRDKRYVYRTIEPGWFCLEGSEALSYARMRKAAGDGESDIKRTARQRKVVESIIRELRNKSVPELQKIANEVLPMVTTSMTKAEITDTLATMISILPDLTVNTGGTCPAEYGGGLVDIYKDGTMHSVLWFNKENTKKTMRAITEGEGLVDGEAETQPETTVETTSETEAASPTETTGTPAVPAQTKPAS